MKVVTKKEKERLLAVQLSSLPKVDKYFTSTRSANNASSCIGGSNTDPGYSATVNEPNEVMITEKCLPTDDEPQISSTDIPLITPLISENDSANEKREEKLSNLPNYNRDNDVGLWTTLSKEDISFWTDKGPASCQHWDNKFEKSKQIYQTQSRYCSKGLFQRKKANGENETREWLVYSPTTGCVYCFVCKLFSNSMCGLANAGFNDWKNSILITHHENSTDHRSALLSYITRRRGSTVNSKLELQIIKEKEYWTQVLKRVVATVIKLAERGLLLRGDNEKFNSPQNGNFLRSLELIA